MVTSLDDVTSVFVVIVVCGVVGDMVVIIDSDEFRNVVLFEEFVKIADSVEFTLKDAEFDILVVINMCLKSDLMLNWSLLLELLTLSLTLFLLNLQQLFSVLLLTLLLATKLLVLMLSCSLLLVLINKC